MQVWAVTGLSLLDPHGDLVAAVAENFPEERREDLVLWRVADRSSEIRFNPLERVPPEKRPVAAAGPLEVFKKLWADSWGPRLEHILRNALFALLDPPEATLPDIPRLLTDSAYRRRSAGRVFNAQVREFWLREYEGYTARLRSEAIAPVQNKVGAFLADPVLRTILTAPRSTINLREMMDGGKVLVVDLAKGQLGEDTSALLGALLVTSVGVSALGRADQPEDQRRPF